MLEQREPSTAIGMAGMVLSDQYARFRRRKWVGPRLRSVLRWQNSDLSINHQGRKVHMNNILPAFVGLLGDTITGLFNKVASSIG